jgi:acyl-CoA thioester hydrolase
VRIYFEDTDFTGIVYHGSYIRFLERGRSDFVRMIGIGHTELGKGDHGLKPARIDDLIEIETSVLDLGGASIVLRQTVKRGDETLADAEVTVVLVSHEGRARRIPDSLRDILTGTASR